MLWHKEHTFKGYPFAYVKQTDVKWNITDAFPNGGDLSKVFPPEQELKESYEYEGKTYGTRKAIGAGIYLRHVWGTMVPAFYKDPKENHTSYAYTWVYSPKDQEVGLWAEFQNYSRSEMDLAPLQGKWGVGIVEMKDAETGRKAWVDTSSARVREHYARVWQERSAAILSALKHHRIDTAEVSTDGDYVVELIKLFKQR